MTLCDLHMHSSLSDGTDTPRRLVELAAAAGLAAIAVTDHDTTAAWEDARDAGAEFSVRVLSGAEISVEHGGRTVHLLAYCFDAGVERLRAGLADMRTGRDERNRAIVARFNDLGIPLTYEEVAAHAGDGGVVGRPHFARVLLDRGVVATLPEAFDRFLARGAAAYVDRRSFSLADAIAMVRGAGGVAVLAHPKLIKLAEGESMAALLESLVAVGLGGLECRYSLHSPDETAAYLALADRLGLVATGGSDYHGANKPDIRMGTGKGDLRVPVEAADALEARAGR